MYPNFICMAYLYLYECIIISFKIILGITFMICIVNSFYIENACLLNLYFNIRKTKLIETK